jgi:hypothetical protein
MAPPSLLRGDTDRMPIKIVGGSVLCTNNGIVLGTAFGLVPDPHNFYHCTPLSDSRLCSGLTRILPIFPLLHCPWRYNIWTVTVVTLFVYVATAVGLRKRDCPAPSSSYGASSLPHPLCGTFTTLTRAPIHAGTSLHHLPALLPHIISPYGLSCYCTAHYCA